MQHCCDSQASFADRGLKDGLAIKKPPNMMANRAWRGLCIIPVLVFDPVFDNRFEFFDDASARNRIGQRSYIFGGA